MLLVVGFFNKIRHNQFQKNNPCDTVNFLKPKLVLFRLHTIPDPSPAC